MATPKEQKIIWITGASSGIGEALTNKFLNEGFLVIASSRTHGNLPLDNPLLHYIETDVTQQTSIESCIDIIKKDHGKIDIALLNAGVCEYLDMPDFDLSIINKNFSINFFGLVNCIKACMPLLKQSSAPHIAGMCSSAVYLPFARAEGYGSSKAASLYFLQSLQAHLYKEIKVSIILPGFVKTPLTDRNDFPMPFLVSSEYAANYIYSSIVKGKSIIEFPRRLIWLLKFIRVLPYFVRINILASLGRHE